MLSFVSQERIERVRREEVTGCHGGEGERDACLCGLCTNGRLCLDETLLSSSVALWSTDGDGDGDGVEFVDIAVSGDCAVSGIASDGTTIDSRLNRRENRFRLLIDPGRLPRPFVVDGMLLSDVGRL